MTTRRKWLLAAAALAAVIAVVILHPSSPPPPEPSYASHTLSEWAEWAANDEPSLRGIYTNSAPHPPPTPNDAIRHIGTNAVPYLLRWIAECNITSPKHRVAFWLGQHLPRPLSPLLSSGFQKRLYRAEAAQHALGLLGPAAASAISELERVANGPDPETEVIAIETLYAIGPQSLPALGRIARNTNSPVRDLATNCFQMLNWRPTSTNTSPP